jgi:hypothetical protein
MWFLLRKSFELSRFSSNLKITLYSVSWLFKLYFFLGTIIISTRVEVDPFPIWAFLPIHEVKFDFKASALEYSKYMQAPL